VDADGWGDDAPPVTRTQLEKVPSAYQPTKVAMPGLSSSNHPQSSAPQRENDAFDPGRVRGAYQPVGKVDIAAIRRQAQESGASKDDRPQIVKGSYEPVGKVDIAAIRAKAQNPSESSAPLAAARIGANGDESAEVTRPVVDRSAAVSTSERLTTLPKPKVANKFGGAPSFSGTQAPLPGGFETKKAPSPSPVGAASRTFADQGGKTPAQIWAEKKARAGGNSGTPDANSASRPGQTPLQSQPSGGGEWKSGYTGKSWAAVQTTSTGKSGGNNTDQQRDGGGETPVDEDRSPAGGVGSIRDRFAGAPPMGAPTTSVERSAPPPDTSNKPNRGMPIPRLPTRSSADETAQPIPSPPPQPPRSPSPPTPEECSTSPIRVAMPVARDPVPDVVDAHEEQRSPPPTMPVQSLGKTVPQYASGDDEPEAGPDPARAQAQTAAATTSGQNAPDAHASAPQGGKRALVQYDYEITGEFMPCTDKPLLPTSLIAHVPEDNEIELREGEYVTNIDMVDEDWWAGENARGQTGLFPANYVELVEDDQGASATTASANPTPSAPAAGPSGDSEADGPTATALYDYEAAGKSVSFSTALITCHFDVRLITVFLSLPQRTMKLPSPTEPPSQI
jgi:drebrin-like protein